MRDLKALPRMSSRPLFTRAEKKRIVTEFMSLAFVFAMLFGTFGVLYLMSATPAPHQANGKEVISK